MEHNAQDGVAAWSLLQLPVEHHYAHCPIFRTHDLEHLSAPCRVLHQRNRGGNRSTPISGSRSHSSSRTSVSRGNHLDRRSECISIETSSLVGACRMALGRPCYKVAGRDCPGPSRSLDPITTMNRRQFAFVRVMDHDWLPRRRVSTEYLRTSNRTSPQAPDLLFPPVSCARRVMEFMRSFLLQL